MPTLFNPFFVPVDGNGNVRAAAKLYFYGTGTTTPAPTYSDSGLSVTNTNPVVADSNGLFPSIYLDNSTTYKAVLKDSADVTIATRDPITSLTPTSISAVLGYAPGNPAGSTTTYLQADVPLVSAGVYYDGPSTGSIGGAGQKWLIESKSCLSDSAGAATFNVHIHDGTNVVDAAAASTGGAAFGITIPTGRVVTLAGATTFTIKAAGSTATGTLVVSSDGGSTNLATSITAIRLT